MPRVLYLKIGVGFWDGSILMHTKESMRSIDIKKENELA